MSRSIIARIVSYFHTGIGVDSCDDCSTKPVITNGEQDMWIVEQVITDRRVTLRIGGYEADIKDDNVVANSITTDPPHALFEWTVDVHFINGAFYSIVDAGTNRAWAVTSTEPKSQIKLTPYNKANPDVSQLFDIIKN